MIIQTSCSELLVNTQLHDVDIAYKQFKLLFDKFELASDPPLSKDLLRKLKNESEKDADEQNLEIFIYDKFGNRCYLEYGENGYTQTGFRFDTQCSDGDEKCFSIFKIVLDNLKSSKLEIYDGGHREGYDAWEARQKC